MSRWRVADIAVRDWARFRSGGGLLRSRTRIEHRGRVDIGLLVFGFRLGADPLAAGLTFGLLLAAGDIDDDRNADLRMEGDADAGETERLDRMLAHDLLAVHREAAF